MGMCPWAPEPRGPGARAVRVILLSALCQMVGAELRLIEKRLPLSNYVVGLLLTDWYTPELGRLEHGFDLSSQTVAFKSPIRDLVLKVGVNRVTSEVLVIA